jgi:superfamily II DNA or RNA helicase
MPRIFDNISNKLLDALRATLATAKRADFCVGYLNLRGWRAIDDIIKKWNPADGSVARVLVGMQRPSHEDIKLLYQASEDTERLDNASALRLKLKFAQELKEQITFGIPTDADESGLRALARQLRAGQVVVKLFLPYPLHAKLYLLFRDDANNPATGFVGSSNLTMAGLKRQGELNVDVLDHDATSKLAAWFEDRWNDRWCLDLSSELAEVIETSWARETPIPPYHIYLNMAYHLSTEARAGLSQFRLPARFEEELFDFQKSAVKIAARHLHRRGGVMIGDVVGLGKTMMATALARMFEDDLGFETLIICPKNLEPMWEQYRTEYGLRGAVMPVTKVTKDLANLRRYRLVLIDESHNLRNREGRRYKAIADYIRHCDARVILLTATPYNKTKADLSSQLRLFIDDNANLGIRPEHHMRLNGFSTDEFERRYQCKAHSIVGMEKSEEFDDWRELIRLYMVRRTRSFIVQHYTEADASGRRFFVTKDGDKRYFPTRKPKSLKFAVDDSDPLDDYAQLYSADVVDRINRLHVPRYGLGLDLYVDQTRLKAASPAERKQIENLSRAGKRLMGFCRTNLFKRLESSGFSFLQSLERHILRNQIYLYAIENGLALPIGTLNADLISGDGHDQDSEGMKGETEDMLDGIVEDLDEMSLDHLGESRAAEIYAQFAGPLKKKFKWVDSRLFKSMLAEHLQEDTDSLSELLQTRGKWQPEKDRKLAELIELVNKTHSTDKVLVFTQFADTAQYIERALRQEKVSHLGLATGITADPFELACRFSPASNNKPVSKHDEIRVLICTDVLSEGQNLQDCAVVVNFDLPWAIIRLIQRAGRVDRIGQTAEEIYCYSFLPAEGVERLIQLRARIQQRLNENAEVVGTDEAFFEEDEAQTIRNLYTEQSGVLDDLDDEVDLASYALQIWKQATKSDPELARAVEALPPVVYSARAFDANQLRASNLSDDANLGGSLVYVKSPEGNDHLAWIGQNNKTVTESQFVILRAAECTSETPALQRATNHHELVATALGLAVVSDKAVGGGLGRPSSPRRRAYERLKNYAESLATGLFRDEELERVVDDIYRQPLLDSAADLLNRLMRAGVNDEELALAAKSLREESRLTYSDDQAALREPKIVCSMGLIPS